MSKIQRLSAENYINSEKELIVEQFEIDEIIEIMQEMYQDNEKIVITETFNDKKMMWSFIAGKKMFKSMMLKKIYFVKNIFIQN